ncbi:MAG: hypothetical protein ABJ327_16445 [Litoreibacter sp.]
MKHFSIKSKDASWDNGRLNTTLGQLEGVVDATGRITGAAVRAFLALLLIATPSLLLPGMTEDSTHMVMLVGLFGALIVFIEYSGTYPGLVEFRNAPPFNRVRFVSLFVTLFLLAIMYRGTTDPTTLTRFVSAIGALVGHVIDFPYSPVRLILAVLPPETGAGSVDLIRASAGLSYLISLATLLVFMSILHFRRWPNHGEYFNFWTNLPTFDPTTGGDVVERLSRDARFNIALGFLLPFLTPAVASSASSLFREGLVGSPQTVVWMVALWAFLPASLFMRGIAMHRIADMIEEKRSASRRAVEAGMSPSTLG